MNQQLQQAFQQFLNMLTVGGQIAAQQVPDILQQEIVYARAVETAALVGSLLVLCVGLYAFHWFLVNPEKRVTHGRYNEDFTVQGGVSLIVGVLGILLGTIFTVVNAATVAQVWFAPKLYLIDWLKTLVTGK